MSDIDNVRFLAELLGSKDLEPEEDTETIEELEKELKDLGFDVPNVKQQMAAFKLKLAGKLAMKRTAESRRTARKEAKAIAYPGTKEKLIEEISVMEESIGYGHAARMRAEMAEDDLKAYYRDLMELKEERDRKDHEGQSNQS